MPTVKNATTYLLSFLLVAVFAAPASAQISVSQITWPDLRPQAVAVHQESNHVFIADDTTGKLFQIDGNTHVEANSVQVGKKVSSIVIDEVSCKVYVASHTNGKITVVDGTLGYLRAVLGRSYTNFPQLALDSLFGKVYALSSEGLVQIDIATDTETLIPGFGGGGFEAMAVNTNTHEVFVTRFLQNTLVVVNGTTLATTTIAGLGGLGIGVNPTENKVYISRGGGAGVPFKILDRDTSLITSIFPGNEATKFVFNPTSNRVYTDSEVNEKSTVIEGSDSFFNRAIPSSTLAVGVRNSTNHVYYAGRTFIGILDDSTQQLEFNSISNPTPSSNPVQGIAVNQGTGRVYLIHDGDALNFVSVVKDSGTPPALDIRMSQPNYSNGQTISANDLVFSNFGVLFKKVELKVWFKVAGIAPFTILNLGSDGSLTLPPGLNQNLGPMSFFTVTSETPRGTYELSSRIIDPATGELLSEDLNPFDITGPASPAGVWQTSGGFDEITAGGLNQGILGASSPIFYIDMSQSRYVSGETVTASVLGIQNPTPVAATVELKIWLKMPGMTAASMINLGSNGSFILPADDYQNLGPLSLFVANSSMPLGAYEFGSRMVDPVTGQLISADLNTFVVLSNQVLSRE